MFGLKTVTKPTNVIYVYIRSVHFLYKNNIKVDPYVKLVNFRDNNIVISLHLRSTRKTCISNKQVNI